MAFQSPEAYESRVKKWCCKMLSTKKKSSIFVCTEIMYLKKKTIKNGDTIKISVAFGHKFTLWEMKSNN